eukprot:jgi/Tetstr1/425781/TSEL_001564.t1
MLVDAMLGGKNDAAAAIFWRKMFPRDVLKKLASVEQEVCLAKEVSHTNQNLYKAVAELCRNGHAPSSSHLLLTSRMIHTGGYHMAAVGLWQV